MIIQIKLNYQLYEPEILLGKNNSFTLEIFNIGNMGYEFMMG